MTLSFLMYIRINFNLYIVEIFTHQISVDADVVVAATGVRLRQTAR